MTAMDWLLCGALLALVMWGMRAAFMADIARHPFYDKRPPGVGLMALGMLTLTLWPLTIWAVIIYHAIGGWRARRGRARVVAR